MCAPKIDGLSVFVVSLNYAHYAGPANFRSDYFSNWTGYGHDYPRCHPLRFPLNSPNDASSFAVAVDAAYFAFAFVAVDAVATD